jgi:hypothetical protein
MWKANERKFMATGHSKSWGEKKKLTQPPMSSVKGDDCIIAGFPVVHGRQPQGHGK